MEDKIKRGDLVKIILKESLYLVPMHGWFELVDKLGDFFKNGCNENILQIKEITGYISGGGRAAVNRDYNYYQINPFGSKTMQLKESGVYSTGTRMGDIIVYEKDIERIRKLL